MSEAVDSFNSKLDEIKEDRQKFEILMDEFFESKDNNIKELLAEMMLHVIMTRGEELQIKFKELEDRRKLYGDWAIDDGSLGIGTISPNTTINITPNTTIGPNYTYPQWTYTDNTYIIGGSGGGASSGVGGISGTRTVNNSDIIDINNNGIYTVSCNSVATSFNLDIDGLVEDIEFDIDAKINTALFENAVIAMTGTWTSAAK